MSTGTYTHRPWRVAAIQWKGDNLAEVGKFFEDRGYDLGDIGLTAIAYTGGGRDGGTIYVLQFSIHDDEEVYQDRWVVIPLNAGDDPKVEIMFDDEFNIAYRSDGDS